MMRQWIKIKGTLISHEHKKMNSTSMNENYVTED